jgi:hypothetical protein
MRTRNLFPVVFILCLILVITNIAAAERSERTADRTKVETRDGRTVEFSDLVRRDARQARLSSPSESHRATALLSMAAHQKGSEALSTLMRILALDLERTAGNEKLLSEVYSMLGDLYEGNATKQVHWYNLAMQYTPDAGARAWMGERITELGGEPFAPPSTREIGYDSCDEAAQMELDFYTTMSIIAPGDHDWFMFDILPGGESYDVTIATSSTTPYFDDTDLTLWRGCSEGIGQEMWSFDDDGGPGYLSLIETGCLAYGTYYIEVGGWLDLVTPDDFTLMVYATDTCYPPSPDGYEPDDDPDEASEIGLPTSLPMHANGWGRTRKEIQDHSIYPAGDIDFARFRITGNEWVRMSTAASFPTFFNGFTASDPADNPDTAVSLLYGEEPNYGGFCNNPPGGFPDFCYTDEDCVGLVVDPIPFFPDCIPFWDFVFPFVPFPEHWWRTLAIDLGRSAIDRGAELFVCLPRGDHRTPLIYAENDWVVRVDPYTSNDTFDYQLQVKNEVGCEFELEPNNSFGTANQLPSLNGEINGFWEFSAFDFFTADADLFSFDVDELTALYFETDGYDTFDVDTALELYVGPSDYGDYFFTGFSNDDCIDWLSCLDVVLPPANDLLGNVSADADYFMNVTSWWLNKNYPYTLRVNVVEPPVVEAEPNDSCETANPIGSTGTAAAEFNPSCDYDSWLLTLDEPGYAILETDGGGDTTMALLGGGGQYFFCDDDSGPAYGSRIEGCLPAGEYFVRLRPYGYWMEFDYELSTSVTPGCVPTDPPDMTYDGMFRCSSREEFDSCPN